MVEAGQALAVATKNKIRQGVQELTENVHRPTRVLLVGYNGANNTGSEARLLAIIDDLRIVFGADVQITVPTLNEENLRRYITEGPTISIKPIPTIFFGACRRLVEENDMVLLVEGSCYMDTWTSSLLWAFLWATRCAHDMDKPSMAYAVDTGRLSRFNSWLVRREASKTDLIVTRNRAAADLLTELGVKAPIEVTADTAFYFHPDPVDTDMLGRVWPGTREVVGIAPVDFYRWPVVIRPWGKEEDCYRWPYYYSTSDERKRDADALAAGLAAEADRLVEKHGKRVALIGMEGLDDPICRLVHEKMLHGEDARVFTSLEYNASQMTAILRSLGLLVTSRYHAAVLSMEASVPLVAVAHDLRLKHLMDEIGLADSFLHYTDEDLFDKLSEMVDRALANPGPIREEVAASHRLQSERASNNRDMLRQVALSHDLRVVS